MKKEKNPGAAISAYRSAGDQTDPLGSYTGNPAINSAVLPPRSKPVGRIDPAFPGGKRYLPPERYYDLPTQDADDL